MIAFSFLCALLHFVRGRDMLPGNAWTMAVLIALVSPFDYWCWPVIASGILLWEAPGLGKYFACVTGQDDPHESEIGWIDWIGYKVFSPNSTIRRNIRRGLLCMSLRGFYMAPMLIALGLIGHHVAFWLIPACLLQGPAYWLWGKTGEQAVGYGELTMGFILGVILCLAS